MTVPAELAPDDSRVLQLLEDYFGRPYPYAKLDSMAIPITVNFGAMENAGLITYRANILLHPADREDERAQRRYVSIAAHEIARHLFDLRRFQILRRHAATHHSR